MQKTWVESQTIKRVHFATDIKQVALWLVTKDKHIIIVSKDGKEWELPGGIPKYNEGIDYAVVRLLKETTGLEYEQLPLAKDPYFLGYNHIIEDENFDKLPYLQIKFLLSLDIESLELDLTPKHSFGILQPVKFAKVVDLYRLPYFISWIENSDEYESILGAVFVSSLSSNLSLI